MTARPSVLITGASRGLGHELNRLYLERGWATFPLIRDASIAADLAQLSPGRCYRIVADLSRDDASGFKSDSAHVPGVEHAYAWIRIVARLR